MNRKEKEKEKLKLDGLQIFINIEKEAIGSLKCWAFSA